MPNKRLLRAFVWTSVAAVGIVAFKLAQPPTRPKRSKRGTDLTDLWNGLGLAAMTQGARPTCSVFAMVHALQFALAVRRHRPMQLSPEFLNWAKNDALDRRDDGGTFADLWAGFLAHGVCSYDAAPYHERYNPDWRPSDEAIREARQIRDEGLELGWIKEWDPSRGLARREFGAILDALAHGTPVLLGTRWPKRLDAGASVVRWVPADGVFDGHSVLLVGYEIDRSAEGRGRFLAIDSGGHGPLVRLTFRFVRAYANDAAWIG